jgi:dihydrofolate reductase
VRKLKLQLQISVDGFIAGKNGEMDWITWNLGSDILKCISDLNKPIDLILLGKNLAEGFIPHWKGEATDPTKKRDFVEKMSEPYDFALKMYETPKIVFTKSMQEATWDFTTIENGDLVDSVNKLKKQNGGDIIVYGGGAFVSSLIKAGLIDEFNLFVNPVAIGNGMTIFKTLENKQNLILKAVQQFECGIVLLTYELKKQ